jgi:hypothetical protein
MEKEKKGPKTTEKAKRIQKEKKDSIIKSNNIKLEYTPL